MRRIQRRQAAEAQVTFVAPDRPHDVAGERGLAQFRPGLPVPLQPFGARPLHQRRTRDGRRHLDRSRGVVRPQGQDDAGGGEQPWRRAPQARRGRRAPPLGGEERRRIGVQLRRSREQRRSLPVGVRRDGESAQRRGALQLLTFALGSRIGEQRVQLGAVGFVDPAERGIGEQLLAAVWFEFVHCLPPSPSVSTPSILRRRMRPRRAWLLTVPRGIPHVVEIS